MPKGPNATIRAMNAFISHTTALWILVALAEQQPLTSRPLRLAKVPSPGSCSVSEIRSSLSAILGSSLPSGEVDLLAREISNRRTSRGACPHCWSSEVPSHSFMRLADSLYLSSPEFCFLQMAGSLSQLDLTLLGYALCGEYIPATIEKGFISHKPITSVERVQRYLSRVPNHAYGLRKAKRAIAQVIDGSRSPMETRLALLLTLPKRRGGYGIERPVLNKRWDFSQEAAQIAGMPYCLIDVFWERALFGYEYLGSGFHDDLQRDTVRDLAIRHDGGETLPLVKQQVYNQKQLAAVAKTVNRKLGNRSRPLPAEFMKKNKALMNELFPPAIAQSDGVARFAKPSYALPPELAEKLDPKSCEFKPIPKL